MEKLRIMNSYDGKRLTALVREGDYAHAGGEEAIEFTMKDIAKDSERYILDAGCGRGGTAAYLKRHGWGDVTGFDIESQSIELATNVHPDLKFIACDIVDAPNYIREVFDLIVLFNVFHALPDQRRGLKALSKMAKPNGRLIVFDYVDRGGYADHPVMENDEPFFPHPPHFSSLNQLFSESGWVVENIEEIDNEYLRWYTDLVGSIEQKRSEIEAQLDSGWYEHALHLYSGTLNAIRKGLLGGVVLTARLG